jgi:hypothetical protein
MKVRKHRKADQLTRPVVAAEDVKGAPLRPKTQPAPEVVGEPAQEPKKRKSKAS